jgi:hypothetical protein
VAERLLSAWPAVTPGRRRAAWPLRKVAVARRVQLTLDGREEPSGGARGPKGARVGDIVIVDRAKWSVEGLDLDRREVICRLVSGSRVYRHFRARAIVRVERGDAR